MKGLTLSREFCYEVVLPAISTGVPGMEDRAACGLLGMGSECFAADDALSRDHHWGPRLSILLTRADYAEVGDRLQTCVRQKLPESYRGYGLESADACGYGVFVESIDAFFSRLCGHARPPEALRAWLDIAEEDLFKATTGEVFHDPVGELTQRRAAFAYYPDPVWHKRLFDWTVLFSQWANYNLLRIEKRGDVVAHRLYEGRCLQKLLELSFLLNRRYAPDKKWLYWHFVRLPELAPEMIPKLERLVATSDRSEKYRLFGEMAGAVSDAMFERGLLKRRVENVSHPEFGYRGLADAIPQLRTLVPSDWITLPVNQASIWEGLYKDVVTFTLAEYLEMTGRGGTETTAADRSPERG